MSNRDTQKNLPTPQVPIKRGTERLHASNPKDNRVADFSHVITMRWHNSPSEQAVTPPSCGHRTRSADAHSDSVLFGGSMRICPRLGVSSTPCPCWLSCRLCCVFISFSCFWWCTGTELKDFAAASFSKSSPPLDICLKSDYAPPRLSSVSRRTRRLYAFLSCMNNSAASGFAGLPQLGSVNRDWIDVKTELTV